MECGALDGILERKKGQKRVKTRLGKKEEHLHYVWTSVYQYWFSGCDK